jgi:hypothetical protein
MHPHLIDWLRNVEINPDQNLAQQRWKAAEEFAASLSRASVPRLLRIFLLPKSDAGEIAWMTDELLRLDPEFPASSNAELVRLMAGVVMVTTFEASSAAGYAFALSLRFSGFLERSLQPAQPAIMGEAEKYLQSEAEKQRPNDFSNSTIDLMKPAQSAAEKILTPDPAHEQAVDAEIERLSSQVRRLAEETALLWWVLAEYSDSLKRRTPDLKTVEYALVAGAEAADRTHVLPPPASASALLARALKPCKIGKKKTLTLGDFFGATDPGWRGVQLKKLNYADSVDLLPIITGLDKCEEFGDQASALQVLPKLCPGLDPGRALSTDEAAYEFYGELMFLRALGDMES